MNKNKHLLLRIERINNIQLLKNVDELEKSMDEIMKTMNFHIVNRCKHQFLPYGATMIYLLAESHCSAHTFWETNEIYIDLFSCADFDHDKVINLFLQLFKSHHYHKNVIMRSQLFTIKN
jgi:S-adenosylmethionine decarboxylase